MLVAGETYKQWNTAVFGSSTGKHLPVPLEKQEAFAIALFQIGYAPSTMMNKYINGVFVCG